MDSTADKVRRIAPTGALSTIAGTLNVLDGGKATSGRLFQPGGLAFDSRGTLLIADERNHRIRVVSPSQVISTVAGNGDNACFQDGGPATAVGLCSPGDIMLDAKEDLFLTEGGRRILKMTPGGRISVLAGNATYGSGGDGGPAALAQFRNATAVTIDPGGNLFIADQSDCRVRKVSPSGIISAFAGTGQCGVSGDRGPATAAQLSYPSGLVIDAAGNLLIAEWTSGRVRKVSAERTISTLVSGLSSPSRMVLDAAGNLFVAEVASVRRVSPRGALSLVAGTRSFGFSGDGGSATAAQLNSVRGVALDPEGNLYVSDSANHRIRRVSPADSGLCTVRLSSSTGNFTAAGGSGAVQVTASAAGCVWTAESDSPWITIRSGGKGAGYGAIMYDVPANPSTLPRSGRIALAGLTYLVSQAGVAVALPRPQISAGGVVNAASSRPPITPGSFVTIYGEHFTNKELWWDGVVADAGTLPPELGGVKVRINKRDCFVYYASPTQLNVLTPPDDANGSVPVEVITAGGTATSSVVMAPYSPAFFTYTLQGRVHPIALLAGERVYVAPVGALLPEISRPARPGDYLQLYANGLGPTKQPYPIGRPFTADFPIADLLQVRVTIGGVPARVQYAGMTYPGLYQVNIQAPVGLPEGDLPLVLTIGGYSTQADAVLPFQR